MVKAYVLVVTDPGATKRVFEALMQVPGVTEVHEVMGPYDIIVEIEVANLVDVPPILSTAIRSISAGSSVLTVACVATGMKMGVGTGPWAVASKPARAFSHSASRVKPFTGAIIGMTSVPGLRAGI
mgnify:CR=1 FL=1